MRDFLDVGGLDPLRMGLQLIGAFYVFAGVIGVRVAVASRQIDVMLAALTLERPSRAETLRALWLMLGAQLVLAAGVALALGLWIAVWLFLASAGLQAVYLLLVAPVLLDPADPPDASGRQQTVNATLLYAIMTALVVTGARGGHLVPLESVYLPVRVAAAAMVLGYVAFSLWRFWRPLGDAARPSEGEPAADLCSEDEMGVARVDDPADGGVDARSLSCVKVMAGYGCHPLWSVGQRLNADFAPEDLGLSDALAADLCAWAAQFDRACDQGLPGADEWTEDEARRHAAAGLRLAERLKAERPDLRVIYEARGSEPVAVPSPR